MLLFKIKENNKNRYLNIFINLTHCTPWSTGMILKTLQMNKYSQSETHTCAHTNTHTQTYPVV